MIWRDAKRMGVIVKDRGLQGIFSNDTDANLLKLPSHANLACTLL